jgi:hypothetical protein
MGSVTRVICGDGMAEVDWSGVLGCLSGRCGTSSTSAQSINDDKGLRVYMGLRDDKGYGHLGRMVRMVMKRLQRGRERRVILFSQRRNTCDYTSARQHYYYCTRIECESLFGSWYLCGARLSFKGGRTGSWSMG